MTQMTVCHACGACCRPTRFQPHSVTAPNLMPYPRVKHWQFVYATFNSVWRLPRTKPAYRPNLPLDGCSRHLVPAFVEPVFNLDLVQCLHRSFLLRWWLAVPWLQSAEGERDDEVASSISLHICSVHHSKIVGPIPPRVALDIEGCHLRR